MSDFKIIDRIRGEHGAALEITGKEMSSNGYLILSFRLYKEFERRPGEPLQTSAFLNEIHIDSCHKLLDEAREIMKRERERA